MPQIAIDSQGNKIRWDETKKEWIPVERAINAEGVEIEYDGAKWNPVYGKKPVKQEPVVSKIRTKEPLAMPKRPGVLSAIGEGIKETGKQIVAPVEGAVRTAAGIPAWMAGVATTVGAQPFVGWEKGQDIGQKVSGALMGGGARLGGEKTAAVEEMLSPLAAPFSLALEKGPEVLAPDEPKTQAMLGAGLGLLLILGPKLGITPKSLLKDAKMKIWRDKTIPAKERAAAISEINKAEAGGAKTVEDTISRVERLAKEDSAKELKYLSDLKKVEMEEAKAAANTPEALAERGRAFSTLKTEAPKPAGTMAEQGASLVGEPRGGSMLPVQELPKRVGPVNLERLDVGESAKKLVADMEDALHQSRVKSGRQKVSWSESEEIANSMGGAYEIGQIFGKTAEEVIADTKKSTKFLAEKIEATRTLFKTAFTDAQAKAKAWRDNPTPENEASAQLAYNRWALIQYETGQAAGEVGRALNIHKKLARSKDMILTKNYARMLKDLGHDKLTPEAMQLLASFDATNPIEGMRFLANARKATTKEKFFEVWINSLLSNPATHIVNFSSNALFEAMAPFEKAAGAGVEFIKHPLKPSKRELYFGEAAHSIVGAFHGMREGLNRYAYAMREGVTKSGLSKFEQTGAAPIKAIKGKKGEVIRIPTKELMANDDFWKAIIYSDEIYAQAYRTATKEGLRGDVRKAKMSELIATPTEAMSAAANKAARVRTFQEELGKLGKDFMRLRSRTAALEFVFPFVRTPVNIIKEGLRRTPVGGAEAVSRQMPAAERSMILGRTALSMSTVVLVSHLIREGKITGASPENRAERERLYNTGWRPYSIKIGDNYLSYGRLEPLATYLGIMADMDEIFGKIDKHEYSKLAARVGTAVRNNITNKTFVTGMTDVINATTDPGRYGELAVRRWMTSLVPGSGILGGTTRAIDPEIKEAKKIVDWYKARLPFLSKQVPAKLNALGEPQRTGGTPVSRLLSPVAVSKEVKDPVYIELDRLQINLLPMKPVVGGEKMPTKDARKLMEEAGPEIKKVISTLITSPLYKKLDDTAKRKALMSWITKTKAYQKGMFILGGK